MEKLRILLAMLFIASIFVSCNKDSDTNTDTTLKAETISAKWNVSVASEYESFEFNKSGNYIIVKKNMTKSTESQVILFGAYQISSNTITLSDFGKMTVSDITENSISFELVLNNKPNDEVIITATKQTEMDNSTKTDLLCKTWELLTINGERVKGTEEELTVLFSRAGTYFVDLHDYEEGEEGRGGLAEWKWKDKNESKILYSWDNWGDYGEVSIIELNKDKLVIWEDYGVDGEDTFVLQPLQNSKSSTVKSTSISKTNLNVRKGFLNK